MSFLTGRKDFTFPAFLQSKQCPALPCKTLHSCKISPLLHKVYLFSQSLPSCNLESLKNRLGSRYNPIQAASLFTWRQAKGPRLVAGGMELEPWTAKPVLHRSGEYSNGLSDIQWPYSKKRSMRKENVEIRKHRICGCLWMRVFFISSASCPCRHLHHHLPNRMPKLQVRPLKTSSSLDSLYSLHSLRVAGSCETVITLRHGFNMFWKIMESTGIQWNDHLACCGVRSLYSHPTSA